MKSECVILIPIHKHIISQSEGKSLERCIEVLNNHRIVILLPNSILQIRCKINLSNIEILNIPDKHFFDIYSYNKLKASRFLYKMFRNHKFILTYELDSWVFKDDLLTWCKRDYDYIGAPWFEGFNNPVSNKFLGVGNSGFSLRRVDKMLEIFSDYKNPFTDQSKVGFKCKIKNIFGWIYYQIFRENYFIQKSSGFHEDILIHSLKITKKINIADVKTAIKFSFEVQPEILFELNNFELPFGCHAWEKYNPKFWSRFINS